MESQKKPGIATSPSLLTGDAEAKTSAGSGILASLEGRAPGGSTAPARSAPKPGLIGLLLLPAAGLGLWLGRPLWLPLLTHGAKPESQAAAQPASAKENSDALVPATSPDAASLAVDATAARVDSQAAVLVNDAAAGELGASVSAPDQALSQALQPDQPMPPETALKEALKPDLPLAPAAALAAAVGSTEKRAEGVAASAAAPAARSPVKARAAARGRVVSKPKAAAAGAARKPNRRSAAASAAVSAHDPDVDILESIVKNVRRSERLKARQAKKAAATEKPAQSAAE